MDKLHNSSLDKETKDILSKQKTIASVVNSDGWVHGRQMFVEKIQELQNAFNIDDKDATAMLIDLQSNKKASLILYEFLREFEGSASEVEENKVLEKSYIIRS